MTSRKKIKIGLFGFGCVGKGLYDVLEASPKANIEIKRICVKDRNKVRAIDQSLLTFEHKDILEDEEVNVVVELIDDSEQAFEIVRQALLSGKDVVSANKKMIACHYQELLDLQAKTGRTLLYEAAACASIPVIRNLEEYYDTDILTRLEGIVNGSTNFILSKAQEEGLGFDEALAVAQELGYAESDPSLDVDAHDAAFKLVLLAFHAFGTLFKPESILRIGIRRLGHQEFNLARKNDWKVKLVAHALRTDNGLSAFVIPSFVKTDSNLYQVDDVFNGVIAETVFADRQFFSGRGAGAFPTASAVLSDISALTYDYKYEFKKSATNAIVENDSSHPLNLYIRVEGAIPESLISQLEQVYEISRIKGSSRLVARTTLGVLSEIIKVFPELILVQLPDRYIDSIAIDSKYDDNSNRLEKNEVQRLIFDSTLILNT